MKNLSVYTIVTIASIINILNFMAISYSAQMVSASTIPLIGLPNPNLTPGVARQVTQDTLCTTSTKLVRHTSAETKRQVYAEYGLKPLFGDGCTGPSHSCYEVDHLIPLEAGGADVKSNLWPQLYDGINNAHDKDKLENYLHKQICTNKITIQQAQSCIAKNWIACKKAQMK